jgi:glutamate racemase
MVVVMKARAVGSSRVVMGAPRLRLGLCCAWACGLAFAKAAWPADEPLPPVVEAVVRHATSSPDGSAAFTFVPGDFGGRLNDLPIGVFDSGIGGLTVLEAILSLDGFDNRSLKPGPDGRPDFQHERFVYLGDQANMPYGNYPREGNEAYLKELILKDAVFLLGRRFWPTVDAPHPSLDKPPVKAVVIGCNTATAYGLTEIRAALRAWDIPVFVVGVVEAGARGVLESNRDFVGRDEAIAVLATVGTCNSRAYPTAISSAFGRAGRRVPEVVQCGFPDLAAVIEGDPAVSAGTTVERVIAVDLRRLLDDYRRSGGSRPVGGVVLGCTHFPLVRDKIIAELQRLRHAEVDGTRPFEDLIAAQIDVIDPAGLTARELFRTLALKRLRAPEPPDGAPSPQHLFYISVAHLEPGDAAGYARAKFERLPGRLGTEDVRVVPMTVDLLPEPSLGLIRTRLPQVWRGLGR